MKKIMKIKIALLTIITLIVTIFSVSLTNAKAESKDVGYQYLSKEYVESEIIVNVSDEIVPFLYDIGIDVKDKPETSGWFIWKKTIHHYYYITNEYVNYKITSRHLTNDIDSIIYMVKQLEYYADSFIVQNSELKTSQVELVLSYLRSINSDYTLNGNGFTIMRYAFDYICTSDNSLDFIKYVNEAEYNKFPISETSINVPLPFFFSLFLEDKNKSNSLFIKDKISIDKFNSINPWLFYDPLKSTNKKTKRINTIDLIHMFCVIDGCNYSDDQIRIINKHELGDLISWAGDLETSSIYAPTNEITNFEDVLHGNFSFNWDDFLADVDGYNIGCNLLNPKYKNTLSTALTGYYGSHNNIHQFIGNARYKLFINTVGVNYSNTINSGMSELKRRIWYAMNIDIENDNDIKPTIAYRVLYMKYGKPKIENRIKMAKLFFDYVCISAGYDNRDI